ncbi:MAG TPA: hypothetical protein VN688_33605, partial [Gemmataceae bacterium]|nr:hypothetical protein [Gemmataceae bacterium]
MWLHELCQRWKGRSPRQLRRRSRRSRMRLTVEALEDRTLPAISTTGQLIDAINTANSSGGATTITLAANTTFDFTSLYTGTRNALPVITANIIIVGNGDTIERDSSSTEQFRLFDVASGGSLTLQDLTLQGGVAQGNLFLGQAAAEGGAVYSSGQLNLSGVTVKNNQAIGFDGFLEAGKTGTDGQNAYGGGLYVAGGSVSLSNDTFRSNIAQGGGGASGRLGGNGGNGGNAGGGGIYVAAGTVSLNNATLSYNQAHGGAGGGGGKGSNVTSGGPGGPGGGGGGGGGGQGGGLYVGGGSISLSNDTLNNNYAYGGVGGNGGSGGLGARENNGYSGGDGGTGGSGEGGGMFATAASNVSLNSSILRYNYAFGGFGGNGGDGVSLNGESINGGAGGKGGSGGDGYGGGLCAVGTGNVSLNNDYLSGNGAQGGGGGSGGSGGASGIFEVGVGAHPGNG